MKNFQEYIYEGKKGLMYEDVSIPIASWVHLAYRYKWEMNMHSWEKDDRMGVTFKECVTFLSNKNMCSFDAGKVIFNEKECLDLLNEKFGAKTLQDAIKKCYELNNLYKNDTTKYTYPITEIPVELYILLHTSFDKACDKMSDLKTDWFNHWSNRTMDKISKSRYLKDLNLLYAFKHFYPEPIPAVLILYRGIKNEYDPKHQEELEYNPYSSWTLDKKESERFATYHFTGRFQPPIIADKQTILKTEQTIDNILFFYGSDESEVILKNPVSNIEVTHKKGW